MNIIIDTLSWIISLNVTGLTLLLIIILAAIFTFMCFFSYVSNTSLDEHFDNYTIPYAVIILTIVPLLLLVILFKISAVLFAIVTAVLFILLIAYGEEQRLYPGIREYSLFGQYLRKRQIRIKRRNALKKAKSFLKPYADIMGKHTLSNKHCQILYNPYYVFFCVSKIPNNNGKYPFFEASGVEDKNWNADFFNSLCENFSYNTTLTALHKLFTQYNFMLNDTHYEATTSNTKKTLTAVSNKLNKNNAENEKIDMAFETLDVNNATEAELTALPGINIIQAKKAIKHRDYEEEFKSAEDFISYLNIKPHFAKQLVNRITATPVKQNLKKEKYSKQERIIDLE